MKYRHRVGAIAVAAAMFSVAAIAQNAAPAKSADEAAKAVEARKQLFEDMKKANDPLGAMLKRQRELDPAVVAASAKQIQELAARIPAAYAVDTRQFKDIKTEAGENIWSSLPDFKVKSEALGKAAGELIATAGGGDKGAIQKGMVAMSKTCGSCHDAYRVK